MRALVRGYQSEVVFGAALVAGAEVAAVIESRFVQAVEEGDHLRVGIFELGAQLLRVGCCAALLLAGIPAVGIEIAGPAPPPSRPSPQRGPPTRPLCGPANK